MAWLSESSPIKENVPFSCEKLGKAWAMSEELLKGKYGFQPRFPLVKRLVI